MKNYMKTFLVLIGIPAVVGVAYLITTGITKLLIIAINKMGVPLDLNAWWAGLVVFIILILFKQARK
jgi:hypothetical protein|tara:strand:- start:406 stop:606 length:201 start_codon:yes stop_codon:yes gene_type:complete